jgi:hypothetical protein
LELERLDERLLPSVSSAQTVSQVTDTHGRSVVFYIGKDFNLYESVNGTAAQQLTSSANYHAVSAGLDGRGNAMAYIQHGNGSFVVSAELDAWDAGRMLLVDKHCLFSAFSAADVSERVYYIGANYTAREALYKRVHTPWGPRFEFQTQQLGTGTDYIQVSAGTDLAGKDTAYFLIDDGKVADMHVYAWSESLHQMYYAQNFTAPVMQVIGGRNGYFYCVDWNDNLWEQIPTGDRFGVVLYTNVTVMIGVGTNSEGATTINYERNGGTDVQYDTEYRSYWNMGQFGGVIAGEGGYDFYVDAHSALHQIDSYGYDSVIARNVYDGL